MLLRKWFEKLMSVSRSGDWWTWKVPTLLASGYASWHLSGVRLEVGHLVQFAVVLCGLVIGAVFASIVNDYFDIQDDEEAGKSNRLASFSPILRIVIICSIVLAGWLFGLFFIDGTLSRYCYLFAWISFTCYSVPPLRTKKRGAWGGLFDALGAGFFPTMFVAFSITDAAGLMLPVWFFIMLGVWSLVFGLRGILWHQYQDLTNDRLIGARTFATRFGTDNAQVTGNVLLIFELSCFMAFMIPVAGIVVFWIFLIYLFYALLVSRVIKVRQVVMYQSKRGETCYFPGTFYQTIWPSLLIFLIPMDHSLRILLFIFHAVFFHVDLRINYYHIKRMIYAIPFVRSRLFKWRGMN